MKIKKRFIAGAVCPACQAQDSIVWLLAEEESIQCVRCTFMQKKSDIPAPAPEQPKKSNVQVIQWHTSRTSSDDPKK